jgi:hypothetical protein
MRYRTYVGAAIYASLLGASCALGWRLMAVEAERDELVSSIIINQMAATARENALIADRKRLLALPAMRHLCGIVYPDEL